MEDFLINVEFGETRVAVIENKELKDFHVERVSEKGIFGNIYKGKVEAVIPGMQAAFVDLGLDMNGFLYISEITHRISEYEELLEGKKIIKEKEKSKDGDITRLLKPKQEILVQIVREPINTKGPRLTTHISLPGRYLVLMPFDNHIGISKRIQDKAKRKQLRNIASKFRNDNKLGLIFRTSAENATEKELRKEYKYLFKQWQNIEKRTESETAPSLIHEERDLILRVMRDMLSENVGKIFIDSKLEYKRCSHFLKKFGNAMRKKLSYYKNSKPIFEEFSIQKQVDTIYERKVRLKSGGYILIEPTESLVSIDVNSGSYVGNKGLEDTAFSVNMQAADEITKQIKLRDLGGIIIIDFIDMTQKTHISKLLHRIKYLMESDKAELDFWYSPKAGLVEMTRQRSRKSIKSVFYQECYYCKGKGVVKSTVTVAIQSIRNIRDFIGKNNKIKKITVKLHPEVIDFLLENNKVMLDELRYKNKVEVSLKKIPEFHIEQIEIGN